MIGLIAKWLRGAPREVPHETFSPEVFEPIDPSEPISKGGAWYMGPGGMEDVLTMIPLRRGVKLRKRYLAGVLIDCQEIITDYGLGVCIERRWPSLVRLFSYAENELHRESSRFDPIIFASLSKKQLSHLAEMLQEAIARQEKQEAEWLRKLHAAKYVGAPEFIQTLRDEDD